MNNQEAISILESIDAKTDYFLINDDARAEALDMAISALQAQEETVSRKVYGQISWERDIAVMQLKDLGYSLGEKIRTDGDMISRKAAIEAAEKESQIDGAYGYMDTKSIIDMFESLPSAQPETAKRIVGKSRDGMTFWYQCDMCNEPVDAQDNFCRGCGRRLTDG